jgi:integrase
MRPQEFLALSWDAFDGANITVCRRLREVPKITEMTPEEQLAAGVRGRIKKPAAALPRWIIVPGAKSKAGKRQVVLFKHTVEVLNRHREQQLEQISRGEMKNPDNLIFPTRNGTFIDPSELRKQWKKMLADLGIPHRRMYDTRHTHITHMIDHGVPITVVQDRVGHEDPRMLKVYAKIQAGKQQKHVGALEAELPYTNDEAQVQTQPTGRKARMVIGYCECCAGISTLALVGTVALCVKCGSEYERADERAEFPPLRAVA